MCFDMPKGKEAWLFSREGKQLQYHLFLTPEMAKTSIEDLEVKPRAVHALKRAGISDIGELADIIHCTADLKAYRSLGIKTAMEIMLSLLFFQYSILSPDRRKAYMKDLYELNRKADAEKGC